MNYGRILWVFWRKLTGLYPDLSVSRCLWKLYTIKYVLCILSDTWCYTYTIISSLIYTYKKVTYRRLASSIWKKLYNSLCCWVLLASTELALIFIHNCELGMAANTVQIHFHLVGAGIWNLIRLLIRSLEWGGSHLDRTHNSTLSYWQYMA